MNDRGIKKRNLRILLSDQKADFRAAQDDALGPLLCQLPDDGKKPGPGFRGNGAKAEFIKDNTVNQLPLGCFGNQDLKPALDQALFIEILFHGVTGA